MCVDGCGVLGSGGVRGWSLSRRTVILEVVLDGSEDRIGEPLHIVRVLSFDVKS